MSKPAVNNATVKEDSNQLKKENKSSSGNTANIKGEKRSSDNFASQQQKSNSSNQNRGQGDRSNPQHNDSLNKDRAKNRNDGRQFEKNKPDEKHNEEDKHNADPSTGGAPSEKKFTGRCRLFVGNLTPDITEDGFRKMFEVYGEVSEIYLNPSRGFGFIRLDYRQNAEAAKAGLDGSQRKGRVLRVRFATHGAALKVKNLHPFVSNELLEHSFSQFGELERCVVIVDDRGKSTGEGIVEFVRKPGANSALRRITEGVFLMGMDPKPISVEPLEHKDEEDGLPEKLLTKNEQYKKEREKEPRFAPIGSFEFEFGMRWKELDELEKQRIEQVKKEIEDARLKLEDEMQNALFEYQADQIRQELARQQEELRRLEELRNQDRLRRQQEYELRHQQEERERAQQEERRRADTMMMMRQQELARGRTGGPMDIPGLSGREDMMMAERFGERFGDRMQDRLPDHMGERMPDRMGDQRMGDQRMGDQRMGERMSSGQSGFMWDEKQREDTGPKPLMQITGFNMGNAPSGGQGSSVPGMNQGPGGQDPNSMDEDRTEDTSISKSEDSQETNVSDLPSDDLGKHEACQATFRSPDTLNDNCLYEDHDFQAWRCVGHSDAENSDADIRMHVDVLDADLGSRPVCDAGDANSSTATSSKDSSSHASNVPEKSQSEAASELPSGDLALKLVSCQDSHVLTDSGSCTVTDCPQFQDSSFDTPQITCSELKKMKLSGRVVVPCSEVDTDCSRGTDVLTGNHEIVKDSEDNSDNQMVVNLPVNCLTNTSNIDTNLELRDIHSSADSVVYNEKVNINYVLVNKKIDEHPATVYPQNTTSRHRSSSPQSGSPSQYSQTSQSPDHHGVDEIPHCTSLTGSQCWSNGTHVPETKVAEESHLPEASVERNSFHNQNICLSYVEKSESEQSQEDNYEHSAECNNEQSLESVPDSSYGHAGLNSTNNGNYSVESDNDVSSYRQQISNDTEEMDTGVLDEDDVSGVTVNSSVYQSYEDALGAQCEATTAAVGLTDLPLVAHYDTTDSHVNGVNPAEETSNVAVLCSSQPATSDAPSSCTAIVPFQGAVTDAATSSTTEEVTTSTPSSSPSLSAHQHLTSEQERMFAQGEQAFISARQAASVPFVPAGCQLPYVPGINPSMYAGPAMVQGLAGPTMMTSSSVHIAQHPGGATIMQHQSMSAGLSGAMSQATMMQQQAMANGVQATSVLQRTLTNGGQTMLVQQRTMTTGLDGMTQQTVVQQQMAGPGMASAALFHANAMRQQQASMMQQRSIRLVQTGMVGNPMMHAQTLRGAALIPGGTMGPLIGHGMLRGVSQGTMMQQLVRQRYLGGPVMPGRGVQLMAGRPIRVKMTYPRESMPMDT
ncbi:hypothetical protein BsWGS_27950 [Bradybaena similaris]